MKIVDCHTHLGFGGELGLHGQVTDLIRALDDAKIDKAVVLAGMLNDCTTERALEEIHPYKDRLAVMGSVSLGPDFTQREDHGVHELWLEQGRLIDKAKAWIDSHDIIGMKFYSGYEHFYPHDPHVRPILDLCDKAGIPALFHCGDLYSKGSQKGQLRFCHPLELDRLASEMPTLKIVMAHVGNPFLTEAMAVLLSKANVYADVSGFVYGTFGLIATGKFINSLKHVHDFLEDPSKLMFGSDWPIADPKSYKETTQLACRQLGLTKEQSDMVMGGNAARVFGLGD